MRVTRRLFGRLIAGLERLGVDCSEDANVDDGLAMFVFTPLAFMALAALFFQPWLAPVPVAVLALVYWRYVRYLRARTERKFGE